VFHPNNQHHGGGALPIKPVDAPLYVITCISNPKRYRQRYHLYRAFEKYVADSGAILYTIEQGFGEREFEITDPQNPRHFRIQSSSEVWHKENMLNLVMHRLPSNWKYVAWIDADIEFARPDWVYETIHLLQHYSFLQMFSQAVDLNRKFEILDTTREGIISYWQRSGGADIRNRKPGYGYGYGYGAGNNHPGYAWAATREAIDHVGGLIDWGAVGSGDWHMASALVGQVSASIGPSVAESCPTYVEWLKIWEANAIKHIKYNVGFMDGLVMHYYHGAKVNRRYFDRWGILVRNNFDPLLDLKKDWQGLWQLTDRNHKLRDDLRAYFATRDEDDRA
jgi:hypothetical protein